MRNLIPLVALLSLAAFHCASTEPRPVITIAQMTPVGAIVAAMRTEVPVDYRLQITNPLSHPITLESVEVETVGMAGGYAMRRVRHPFSQVIEAGKTGVLDFRAWVQPLQATNQGSIVMPVVVRGVARFDALGKTIRTNFGDRLSQ